MLWSQGEFLWYIIYIVFSILDSTFPIAFYAYFFFLSIVLIVSMPIKPIYVPNFYACFCLFVFIYIWLFNLLYDFFRRLKFPWEAIYLVVHFNITRGIPSGSAAKNLPAMQELQKTWVRSLGWEDSLEEEMPTHSSILACETPGTEEPGRLESMGSQRVGHDWARALARARTRMHARAHTHTHTHTHP